MKKCRIKLIIGCFSFIVSFIVNMFLLLGFLFDGNLLQGINVFFLSCIAGIAVFCFAFSGFFLFQLLVWFLRLIMDIIFAFFISETVVYQFYTHSQKQFGMNSFLTRYNPSQFCYAIQEFQKVLKKHSCMKKLYLCFAKPDALAILERRNYGDEN